LWFNCNPGGPSHWFKVKWLEKLKEKNMLHLHFTMDDNPALTDERRSFYASLYTGGVFYKRYILGLWVQAEGAIYDMLTDENYYDELPKSINRPAHYIGIDYGTQNDTAFLHVIDDGTTLWVDKEYYYSGRDTGKQKTNSQYAKDLVGFCEGIDVYKVIIDPSAASFKVELRNNGFRLKDADNDVLDGIRYVATMFGRRLIKINRRCVNLRREIEGYVWDPKPTEKGNEKPIKSADHGCDSLRYIIKTVISPRRLQA
jgi:PBSX family phage terminase large subunit